MEVLSVMGKERKVDSVCHKKVIKTPIHSSLDLPSYQANHMIEKLTHLCSRFCHLNLLQSSIPSLLNTLSNSSRLSTNPTLLLKYISRLGLTLSIQRHWTSHFTRHLTPPLR
jgi:hypothetical protein